MSGDNSNSPPTHLEGTGYWKWSRSLMRLDDHGDAAIFKAHSDLILFDLHMSSAELDQIRKEYFPSAPGTNRSNGLHDGTSSGALSGSSESSMSGLFSSVASWTDAQQSGAAKRWKEDIRPVVHRHVEALLRASELARLPKADDYDKQITRHLFRQKSINLTEEDKAPYEKSSTDYLVVLKQDPYGEFVSRFIANNLIRKHPKFFGRIFGRVFGRAETDMGGIDHFSSTRIRICASMIITVIASTGLIINAVCLYYTRAIGSKLSMIAGFSVLHAFFLSLFPGSAVEVVTGISTWAAVQVFFITATEDGHTERTTNGTAFHS